jgi:hypothetical protein
MECVTVKEENVESVSQSEMCIYNYPKLYTKMFSVLLFSYNGTYILKHILHEELLKEFELSTNVEVK